jgi:O-antigen/teichoic acid export membrane protein
MNFLKTIKAVNLEAVNSLWIFIEKFSKILVGFVLGVYLARILGTEKFGIYTSAISFATIFVGISAIGLNGLLVKEFVKRANIYLALKTSLSLRVLGAIFSYLASIGMAFIFIGNDSVLSGIILVSILIFLTPCEAIGFYFESRLESKYNAAAKSSSFFIGALLKLILLFNGASVNELFIAHVIEGFIWGIVLIYLFHKKTDLSFSGLWKTSLEKKYSKSLLSQSWPLMVSSIAVILYLKLDQIMILEYLGAESSGLYGVSVRVCEAIFLIPAIIIPSLFPKMIKLFETERTAYLLFIKKIALGFTVLSVLITLFLLLTSDTIIPFIFGNEYQKSSEVLKIYSISILFVFLGHIISKWLIIEEFTKLSIARHGMGVIMNIALNILLIPKFGINGAAFASVMSYFMSTLGFMVLNRNGRRFIKELVFTNKK